MKYLLSLSIVTLLLLGNPHGIRSQAEVTLIVPVSIKTAIDRLIPGFERKTGRKVRVIFGTGGGILQQVTRGEVFDVPILQPPFPEVLASGNVVTSSETILGSVSIGVAVLQCVLGCDRTQRAAHGGDGGDERNLFCRCRSGRC